MNILLKNRKISDVDFYINRFDQVVLSDNNTEPMFNIFKKKEKFHYLKI